MMIQKLHIKKNVGGYQWKRPPTLFLQLAIFGLGYCVGFLQSYFMFNNQSRENNSHHQSTDNDSHLQVLVPYQKDTTNWNTIDVFYGNVPSDADIPLGKKVLEGFKESHPWYAQVHQDEVVMALLSHKPSGFFIDLASNEVRYLSNTFALERFGNWTGLCIEPNPHYWFDLARYRPNCTIVAAVVGKHRLEEVYFRFEGRETGGIVKDGFDNGGNRKENDQKHYTVPLLEIFQRHRVPKDIDYLSLDVEGAENYIMENFPFHNYQFKILTIERLKEDSMLWKILTDNGYEFVTKVGNFGESVWILSSIRNELNWSAFEGLYSKIEKSTGERITYKYAPR